MTQTIDQRAYELLERHKGNTLVGIPHYAVAALTEALTRVEELEGALRPFIDEHKAQEEERSPSVQDNDKPYQFYVATYGDLRRSAFTQGIKE